MNSLARVFSNFKEFYNEINGATLTGAIDVVVVEQQDGTYLCSPFHVRFGKLGVLRSREKVVDIEVNGEPVDIHMKLGDSGEAFFVEECAEDDPEIPVHMATSPIPVNNFLKYDDEMIPNDTNEVPIQLPLPRRNSIDFSKEIPEIQGTKFENQTSDYKHRRHTDNAMDRRHLATNKLEYTTQKLRQEWAEQDPIFKMDGLEEIDDSRRNSTVTVKDDQNSNNHFRPINDEALSPPIENKDKSLGEEVAEKPLNGNDDKSIKDDSKGKKKRRKKSIMKKKNSQRKSSVSSSTGSTNSDPVDAETESLTISNNTESSTESSPKVEDIINSKDEGISVPTLPDSLSVSDIKNVPESQNRLLDIHFFSDTEIGSGLSPGGSRPSTPVQSDTEFEVSQRDDVKNVMTNSASWKWGELPTQPDAEANNSSESKQAQRNSMLSGMFNFMKHSAKLRKNAADGGVYLSDLESESMDPEVAALYFPQSAKQNISASTNEDDRESGNGTSLPQSPSSMEGLKSVDSDFDEMKLYEKEDFVAMSLCGGMENGGPTDKEFESQQVQYSEVCQNPSLFSSPNLVVRINRKYYTWVAACPIVMTLLTFQKPLPKDVYDQLTNPSKSSDLQSLESSQKLQEQQQEGNKRNSWWNWRRSTDKLPPNKNDKPSEFDNANNLNVATQTSRSNSREDIIIENHIEKVKETDGYNGSMSSEDSDGGKTINRIQDISLPDDSSMQMHNEKFKKSLRLSTDQIDCLNLKDGMNEVVFSVTTAYQGTSRCKCYLFKWKYNDKVVISDIDGTITKSDVLGHILPMVGKDWAQIGVAQLFSKIEENGYKLLYLSARAIGQSRATREYLRSIRQGDVKLPDGPLLLNPTSLISALHREVIEKKPEQFKIACLSDIKALFAGKNPFYAGYGNRINDVWAYRAVGIPIMRIFTINPKGELKHEFTQTFQSTYCSMTYIVDQLFPPIQREEEDIEYTSFNYWREPVLSIDFEIDLNVTPNDSKNDLNVSQQNNLSKQLPTIPEN